MQELTLTITLASDAEPGSGIGAVGLNQCLSRSVDGRPILRASHLKGLMLDALRQISAERSWDEQLAQAVFGAPDRALSRVRLLDAVLVGDDHGVLEVSRTAVDDAGSKGSGSLRKVEAIPCGKSLQTTVRVDAVAGDAVDLALRLAALAVPAVGGDRNRGAGACQVSITGEGRGPGELLRELDALVATGYPELANPEPLAKAKTLAPGTEPVLRRLILIADGPICCPERPVAEGNTIETGIAIPASAVQGMLLTRLNAVDSALASACFADERFRAWPLLPVAPAVAGLDGQDQGLEALPMGQHVPMSHRISKVPKPDGEYILGDRVLADLPDNETSPGTPLRGCDGVLLTEGGKAPSAPPKTIRLWRAAAIPRELSTHGVHRDGAGKRNLFSVLSMAPLIYSGLVSLPAEAAQVLAEALEKDDRVSVGKARSVRGSGRLKLLDKPGTTALEPVPLPDDRGGRVFIVQSPLVIPDDLPVSSASATTTLAALVNSAGWGELDEAASEARCGLRFGWNRHLQGGQGQHVANNQRLRARRCILPGSVVVLKEPLADPVNSLLKGIGDGREAGFGALLPHPGIATSVVQTNPAPPSRKSDGSGKIALDLWKAVGGAKGPSAAQISALHERLDRGGQDAALGFLKAQKARPARVWQRWQPAYDDLYRGIAERDPQITGAALRGWRDLAAANKEERR